MPQHALSYLLQLRRSKTENRAMSRTDTEERDLTRWRNQYPQFVRLENEILMSKTTLALAKARAEATVLDVTEKMIERATGNGRDGQRAGETLMKIGGLLSEKSEQTINVNMSSMAWHLSVEGKEKA